MGVNLYDFVLSNGPLNLIQKAQMTNGKKTTTQTKRDSFKTESICASKDSQESERTVHWMGEHFGKSYIRPSTVNTFKKFKNI